MDGLCQVKVVKAKWNSFLCLIHRALLEFYHFQVIISWLNENGYGTLVKTNLNAVPQCQKVAASEYWFGKSIPTGSGAAEQLVLISTVWSSPRQPDAFTVALEIRHPSSISHGTPSAYTLKRRVALLTYSFHHHRSVNQTLLERRFGSLRSEPFLKLANKRHKKTKKGKMHTTQKGRPFRAWFYMNTRP